VRDVDPESGKTLDQGSESGEPVGGDLRCALVEGFLIERYWPGVTTDAVAALNGQLDASSDGDVTFVGSILVPADEMVLFEFLATDAQAVLEVSRHAGLRCDRIVSAVRLLPGRATHPGPELGP
jgi:hypothetical protein